METIHERLYARLAERGWRGRAVPVRHVADLQRQIESHHGQGNATEGAQALFDETFYQERLTSFDFGPPEALPGAESVVVVAVPRPQARTTFTWQGRTLALILPPTYAGYEQVRHEVGDLLAEWLAPEGGRVARAALPLKALAVCSGLGEYGRNNICYVPCMGSFCQLVAFYAGAPGEEAAWGEPQMMARCETCEACRVHCPTGAIPAERFLLHAERCLVFHNERAAEHSFPAWIDPAAHHCVMGCMRCQQFCPEDRPFLGWVEGDWVFSEEETALLMQGGPAAQLPATTRQKLAELALLDDVALLPRNLGALFGGR